MENPEKNQNRTDLWERRKAQRENEEGGSSYWYRNDRKPNSRMTQRYVKDEDKNNSISERK